MIDTIGGAYWRSSGSAGAVSMPAGAVSISAGAVSVSAGAGLACAIPTWRAIYSDTGEHPREWRKHAVTSRRSPSVVHKMSESPARRFCTSSSEPIGLPH